VKLNIQGSSRQARPEPDVGSSGLDPVAHRPGHRLAAGCLAAALASSAIATGCNNKNDEEVKCPEPATSVVRLADVSSSVRTEKHRRAIEKEFDVAVAQAAFCPDVEAHLVVFASSAGDSRVLYGGTPEADGQNDRARKHKLKVSVVPGLKRELRKALADASTLGPSSDPLAGFDLLRDYAVTHPGRTLDAEILSDGVSTSSRLPLDHPLTAEDLARAASVPVTAITVTSLVMSGVGATAPPTPPADYVAALRTFWTTVCQRVTASCVVTSEVAK